MKIKFPFFFLLCSVLTTYSQEKIKADIDIMNFLGKVPQKTESNSLAENLLRILYYNIQPESNSKIGFLNTKGEIVVPPNFNMASDFYNGYANIIRDSVYGYINKEGKEVYFENYNDVFFYYGKTGIATKNRKYGLINRQGDSLTAFNYKMIYNFGFDHFKGITNDNIFHILNKEGEIIFNGDLKYDIKSHYFPQDSILIFKNYTDKRELQGLVNIRGEEIIKPKYQQIYFINDPELFIVKKNDKYGFINKKGEEVIPLMYDEVGFNIHENLIPVKKDQKWGFIDRKNNIKIPFEYDDAKAFSNGLAFVSKEDSYGCIDHKNKVKIKFDFKETPYPFFTNNLALFSINGKYGFINKKGRIKIPAKYDKAYPFINGLALVELDGKSGYIDKNGKEIIPIRYRQLWFESDGFIRFIE